jgi:hypothetical protein
MNMQSGRLKSYFLSTDSSLLPLLPLANWEINDPLISLKKYGLIIPGTMTNCERADHDLQLRFGKVEPASVKGGYDLASVLENVHAEPVEVMSLYQELSMAHVKLFYNLNQIIVKLVLAKQNNMELNQFFLERTLSEGKATLQLLHLLTFLDEYIFPARILIQDFDAKQKHSLGEAIFMYLNSAFITLRLQRTGFDLICNDKQGYVSLDIIVDAAKYLSLPNSDVMSEEWNASSACMVKKPFTKVFILGRSEDANCLKTYLTDKEEVATYFNYFTRQEPNYALNVLLKNYFDGIYGQTFFKYFRALLTQYIPHFQTKLILLEKLTSNELKIDNIDQASCAWQSFGLQPFPMVIITKPMASFMVNNPYWQDYVLTEGLNFNQDIAMILTDSPEHQHMVQTYLQAYNMDHIEVGLLGLPMSTMLPLVLHNERNRFFAQPTEEAKEHELIQRRYIN